MELIHDEKRPWYVEYDCESLDDFRKWLCDCSTNGKESPIEKMVFRGLGRAYSYKLIPSAYRDGEQKRLSILNYHVAQDVLNADYRPSKDTVVRAELSELQEFYKEANRQGLALPDIDYFKSHWLVKYNESYVKRLTTWPEMPMLELMALAQHYGLPTRFLDWTENIKVALYFALRDAANRMKDGERSEEPICIWGIKLEHIQWIFEDLYESDCPVRFYMPKYANNLNLQAQGGVLSYQLTDMSGNSAAEMFSVEAVDVVMNKYYSHIHETMKFRGDSPLLCKITIREVAPVSDFEYLTEHGYNAAKLFPGYDGVVRKMQEDEMIRELKRKYK